MLPKSIKNIINAKKNQSITHVVLRSLPRGYEKRSYRLGDSFFNVS